MLIKRNEIIIFEEDLVLEAFDSIYGKEAESGGATRLINAIYKRFPDLDQKKRMQLIQLVLLIAESEPDEPFWCESNFINYICEEPFTFGDVEDYGLCWFDEETSKSYVEGLCRTRTFNYSDIIKLPNASALGSLFVPGNLIIDIPCQLDTIFVAGDLNLRDNLKLTGLDKKFSNLPFDSIVESNRVLGDIIAPNQNIEFNHLVSCGTILAANLTGRYIRAVNIHVQENLIVEDIESPDGASGGRIEAGTKIVFNEIRDFERIIQGGGKDSINI